MTANSLKTWTLDQLRERARLNGLRGIAVSPELRAEIKRREEEAATPLREVAKALYTLAEQADARFSETCRSRGSDRWNADMMIPEIRDAYRTKIAADEAWLTFLRTTRNVR